MDSVCCSYHCQCEGGWGGSGCSEFVLWCDWHDNPYASPPPIAYRKLGHPSNSGAWYSVRTVDRTSKY